MRSTDWDREFIFQDPYRPLDWRWQRATQLATGGRRRYRRYIDDWIQRAASYLKRRRGKRHQRQGINADEDAAIASAVQLHESAGWDVTLVQARILAGQSDDAIANRMCLSRGAIAAYEALHFHVRDRLAGKDWVMCRVIRPRAQEPWDLGQLLRHLAYHGGLDLLDALEPAARSLVSTHIAAGLAESEAHDGAARALRRVLALLAMPRNEETHQLAMRLYAVIGRGDEASATTVDFQQLSDCVLAEVFREHGPIIVAEPATSDTAAA